MDWERYMQLYQVTRITFMIKNTSTTVTIVSCFPWVEVFSFPGNVF